MAKICAYLDGGHQTIIRAYRERHTCLASCEVSEEVLNSLRDQGLFYEMEWPGTEQKAPPVDSAEILGDWLSDMGGDDRVDQRTYEGLKLVYQESITTGVGLVVLMKGRE